MNNLCISTNLNSSDLAAWVQAIGSIIAIIASVFIAMWQSRKQFNDSRRLINEEQNISRLQHAKTLLVLADNCSKAMEYFSAQIKDRESIHKIASKETYFDFNELNHLVNHAISMPLYSLPDSLITQAMIMSSTIRQFKQIIDSVMLEHRRMDGEQFAQFLNSISEMKESMKISYNDINKSITAIESA